MSMSLPPDEAAPAPRSYRYYDFIMIGFVTVLLCSSLIGSTKSCELFGLKFGAGNVYFPISYIIGDVLTEVYGFARCRRVIWASCGALLFAAAMTQVIIHLPLDGDEPLNKRYQPAIELVFNNTWRVLLSSVLAFWCGGFVNSFILAKMKLWTRGRFLWTRTIGSTVIGQGVDSCLFYPLAFFGVWTADQMVKVVLFNWVFKVTIEALLTPLTYLLVGVLKRTEEEDYFDEQTDFTPFSLAE